jgi:hypothetical protein
VHLAAAVVVEGGQGGGHSAQSISPDFGVVVGVFLIHSLDENSKHDPKACEHVLVQDRRVRKVLW